MMLFVSWFTAWSKSSSRKNSQALIVIGSKRSLSGSFGSHSCWRIRFINEDFPQPHSPWRAIVIGVSLFRMNAQSASM